MKKILLLALSTAFFNVYADVQKCMNECPYIDDYHVDQECISKCNK